MAIFSGDRGPVCSLAMSSAVPAVISPYPAGQPSGSLSFDRNLPASPLRSAGYEYVSTENAAEQYLATLGSKASVTTVRSKLNQFARYFNYPDYLHCDWHLMRYENVLAFISHLKERSESDQISTVTINAYLCALKGVAKTAWNLNQITDHDLMRVKNIKQLRVTRKIAGKALSKSESRSFLSQCQGDTPILIRDRAILLLLLGCGLRRAEITAIKLTNVFLDEHRIRLIGKGNKERDVFMNTEVSGAVERWISVRAQIIRDWNAKYPWKNGNAGNGSAGFLFGKWTRHFGYLIVSKPMNPSSVADIVKKYKELAQDEAAGLKTVTTHDLRRTFATRLLDKGIDISTVKNLMGHSSIATTTLYDRRGEDAMRNAVNEVDL